MDADRHAALRRQRLGGAHRRRQRRRRGRRRARSSRSARQGRRRRQRRVRAAGPGRARLDVPGPGDRASASSSIRSRNAFDDERWPCGVALGREGERGLRDGRAPRWAATDRGSGSTSVGVAGRAAGRDRRAADPRRARTRLYSADRAGRARSSSLPLLAVGRARAATSGSSSTRSTRRAARARLPPRRARRARATRSPRPSRGSICATRRTSPLARPLLDVARRRWPAVGGARKQAVLRPDRHPRRRRAHRLRDRGRLHRRLALDQRRLEVRRSAARGHDPQAARPGHRPARRARPARAWTASGEVARHVPGPELDEVAVRVVDVGRARVLVGAELCSATVRALRAQLRDGARRSPSAAMCIAKCTWTPPRPCSSPTCGRHSPIRVRSPAISQIASRSGQRSTTGRPSRPA